MVESSEMTSPELQSYLEILARLVEATAKTPAEAAQIIRDAKPPTKTK